MGGKRVLLNSLLLSSIKMNVMESGIKIKYSPIRFFVEIGFSVFPISLDLIS